MIGNYFLKAICNGKKKPKKSNFFQTGIYHRKYFLVSSLCLVFCGSHKTECSMGCTMLQNYLIPAVEERQETPELEFL